MKNISAGNISSRVVGKVKSGSIVLFHNAAINTPDALPTILETLLADGYTIVPITQLIYKDNYTINHEGRQIPTATTITKDTQSAQTPAITENSAINKAP